MRKSFNEDKTLSTTGFELVTESIRTREFLDGMERVVPWGADRIDSAPCTTSSSIEHLNKVSTQPGAAH